MRPNAIESDAELVYPRKNFEALASLGLLGLLVPRKCFGLGEDHTCAAMVVETIARYGCPSTAMCYTMHLGADFSRHLEKRIGTFSISLGEQAEKSQTNDTETVLVKSPSLDAAFWAMSFPKL